MAEAFALGPQGLAHFYDDKELMQHRAKIIKYPVAAHGDEQGVGPHYDAGFLTFVYSFFVPVYSIIYQLTSYSKHLHTKVYKFRTYLGSGSMYLLSMVLLSSTLEKVG